MIGDPTGLDIVDAGCGEGYRARELIRRVHGADTCGEFVAATGVGVAVLVLIWVGAAAGPAFGQAGRSATGGLRARIGSGVRSVTRQDTAVSASVPGRSGSVGSHFAFLPYIHEMVIR